MSWKRGEATGKVRGLESCSQIRAVVLAVLVSAAGRVAAHFAGDCAAYAGGISSTALL